MILAHINIEWNECYIWGLTFTFTFQDMQNVDYCTKIRGIIQKACYCLFSTDLKKIFHICLFIFVYMFFLVCNPLWTALFKWVIILSSSLLIFPSSFILISALKQLRFQHSSANWLGAVRVYWSSWSNLCPLSFPNPLPLASAPHSAGYHWLQNSFQWRHVPCITPHYVSVSPALKQLHSLNLIQGAVICVPLTGR